jgi:cohesin complex subunit SA-1/2
MELSEPDATPGAGDASSTTRRKSGRTVRKPDLFAEDNFAGSLVESSSAKRKRAQQSANDDEEDLSEDESEDMSESEADEEEIKATRGAARQKKPAPKKQKVVNGARPQLALRPPPNRQKPAKKGKAQVPRVRKSQAGDVNSLYGKISIIASRERFALTEL